MVFGPGETTQTVDIAIDDDAILEDTELFTASLVSDQSNVMVVANASNAEISILDNDRECNYIS